MRITVVGRGNVGGGLADLWERAGHQVTRLGREGGEVSDAEVMLLAVPGDAIAEVFEKLPGIEGKMVIDATNLYGVVPPAGFPSNAEFVKSKTNGPTAKSFNTNLRCCMRGWARRGRGRATCGAGTPRRARLSSS
jgi:predicted dinucleotide-binding enzyme